jgi:hypothetical protein
MKTTMICDFCKFKQRKDQMPVKDNGSGVLKYYCKNCDRLLDIDYEFDDDTGVGDGDETLYNN